MVIVEITRASRRGNNATSGRMTRPSGGGSCAPWNYPAFHPVQHLQARSLSKNRHTGNHALFGTVFTMMAFMPHPVTLHTEQHTPDALWDVVATAFLNLCAIFLTVHAY